MNIGIIDADLIGLQEHNFPNLACMKISSYHKKQNDNTRLITYSEIQGQSLFTETFDIVYISKVFTIGLFTIGLFTTVDLGLSICLFATAILTKGLIGSLLTTIVF